MRAATVAAVRNEPFATHQSPAEIARCLTAAQRRARTHTLELVADLGGERWFGPQLEIVNPTLWEVGHVGWFHEYYVLRGLWGEASHPRPRRGLQHPRF